MVLVNISLNHSTLSMMKVHPVVIYFPTIAEKSPRMPKCNGSIIPPGVSSVCGGRYGGSPGGATPLIEPTSCHHEKQNSKNISPTHAFRGPVVPERNQPPLNRIRFSPFSTKLPTSLSAVSCNNSCTSTSHHESNTTYVCMLVLPSDPIL